VSGCTYRTAALKPVITPVRVSIREDVAGWAIAWDHGAVPERYRSELGCVGVNHRPLCCARESTAAGAERYVRRTLSRLAELGLSTACVIDWIPETRVGRLVVRAITGARGAA